MVASYYVSAFPCALEPEQASKHTAHPTTNQHGRERMGFHSSEISRDDGGISESVGVAYRMGDLDPDAKLDIIVARHLRKFCTSEWA